MFTSHEIVTSTGLALTDPDRHTDPDTVQYAPVILLPQPSNYLDYGHVLLKPHTAFCIGFWESNSGPHVNKASTLANEISLKITY